MNLSVDGFNQCLTYFGVYSAPQIACVSELLKSLGVRYEIVIEEQSEERLRAWTAWDTDSSNPHEGHELYIHCHDLDKVGTRIVEMYPDRKFDTA